ncbi:MAG: 7-cyano-7-deazaguanine synthase QueC [Candidatus Omnitrophica bacterium]|nr:7-cyano-7-deazaguanine synthase QueC [Candidatus Omnitrophota bacterium]
MKKAVILLSGGLDSATSLFWAKAKGCKLFCLMFDYGQRHKKEISQAKVIAAKANCRYRVLKIDLAGKHSSLVNKHMKITAADIKKIIPSTYVPARNMIFLSFAASFAESEKADAVIIGANQIDYSNYPDCRAGFLKAFENAVNKGTKQGAQGKKIKILAPLLNKTKAQIVKMAKRLNVPIELTWSCYSGGKRACGRCPSCVIRAKGFKEAGIEDPCKSC